MKKTFTQTERNLINTLTLIANKSGETLNTLASRNYHRALITELNQLFDDKRIISDPVHNIKSRTLLMGGESVSHSPHSASLVLKMSLGVAIPHLLVDIAAGTLLGFFCHWIWESSQYSMRMKELNSNNTVLNSLLKDSSNPRINLLSKTAFVYAIANELTYRLQYEIRYLDEKSISELSKIHINIIKEGLHYYGNLSLHKSGYTIKFNELVNSLIDNIAPQIDAENKMIDELSKYYKENRSASVLKNPESHSRESFLNKITKKSNSNEYEEILVPIYNTSFYSRVFRNKTMKDLLPAHMRSDEKEIATGGSKYKYGFFGRIANLFRKKDNQHIHFERILLSIYLLSHRISERESFTKEESYLSKEHIQELNLDMWIVTNDMHHYLSSMVNQTSKRVDDLSSRLESLESQVRQLTEEKSQLYSSLSRPINIEFGSRQNHSISYASMSSDRGIAESLTISGSERLSLQIRRASLS